MKTLFLLGAFGVSLWLLAKIFESRDELEPLSQRWLAAQAAREDRNGIDGVCWNWNEMRRRGNAGTH